MQLWIEEKPYSPTDIGSIRKLSVSRGWLVPVLAFLEFWFSEDEIWTAQTSGSTSAPKSIQLARSKLEASARLTVSHFELSSGDGLILCLSASHVGGFMVLARGLIANLDVWVLEPGTDPIPANSNLLGYRSWFVSLVPMQTKVFGKPDIQNASFLWKGILIGGASLSIAQIHQLELAQCPVYQSYGMTETVSHIAVRNISKEPLGNPVPYTVLAGIEIRLNQDDCLMIKGYVTDWQWLETHDRVRMIDDWNFVFLGRADDVINSGGIKIDPLPIQKMISQRLSLEEDTVKLIGLPDEVLGQRLVCVVSGALPNPESIASLVPEITDLYGPKYVPKELYKVHSFPFTKTSKVDKPALIQQISTLEPIWKK